jgi:hypothetical protein
MASIPNPTGWRSRKPVAVLLAGALVLSLASAAGAVTPTSSTINGCINKSTRVLRVLAVGSTTCRSTENKLSWSRYGTPGPTGATGAIGTKGDKGDTGEQGLQGPKGDTGEQGLQGPKGDTGDTGAKGDAGTTGDTGSQGPAGVFGSITTRDGTAVTTGATATASCQAGETAIGGGWTQTDNKAVKVSMATSSTTWTVTLAANLGAGKSLTAQVICVAP